MRNELISIYPNIISNQEILEVEITCWCWGYWVFIWLLMGNLHVHITAFTITEETNI